MPTPQNGQTHSTTRRLLPTNCLSVFDHFVRLVLKGLSRSQYILNKSSSQEVSSQFALAIIFNSVEYVNGPHKETLKKNIKF